MPRRFRFSKILGAICLAAVASLVLRAEGDLALANHVPIGRTGVSFCLTDEFDARAPTATNCFFDREVFTDLPLFCVLHNTTNSERRLRNEGYYYRFWFKLYDGQSRKVEVPLNRFGQLMNSGPMGKGDPTGSVRFTSVPPGEAKAQEFPALNRLFKFPRSGGDLVLEIKFWYRDRELGRWELSDQVRLRVVQREMNGHNISETVDHSRD